ncbi:MAG: M3 family oligoendopeptidase [Chloroflexota bacterium]
MTNVDHKQERWSTEELFPAIRSEPIKQAIDTLNSKVGAFEQFRAQLNPRMAPKAYVEVLEKYEEMIRLVSRLAAYGELKFTEDTQDQAAQTFQAQMHQLLAEVDNQTLFFKLWWKSLEDAQAAPFLDAAGDYRYWLEALRLQKPYTLSEPEEQVINLKDVNGPQAMVTLYTAITNRYKYPLQVDGEVKELTRDELWVYVRDANPELRAAAYRSLFNVFEKDVPILGQIYQFRVRDWFSEQLKMRKYATPISVRNLGNDLPDEVVDMLLAICKEQAPLFQRYFRLKARWIGMDRIRRYDIYAPVAKSEKTYTFADSVEVVLDSFHKFEPRMADLARKVFDEHHIDSEVRPGKMSGAYCMTVTPDLTPWVMQNFQGRPDDVATMAHELGHAIHSLLAVDHTALTQHSSLPLAETASTFGEMLLIDELLERDPDPEVRRDLLFRQMDDSYATIMRQAFFGMFERTAFDLIDGGAQIDELSKAYFEDLKVQFGDSLDLTEDFKIEWLAIPHFYNTPFYVYAYAFGQLLVLSLYQQYQQEGEGFKARYLEILASGGSDSPSRILERAGIVIRSADFWRGGFRVLEQALNRLETLKLPA